MELRRRSPLRTSPGSQGVLLSLQVFEVATNTRIRDLIGNITRKLKLSSADGFSIFVKTEDKVGPSLHIQVSPGFLGSPVCFLQVLSLNDADYFFDSLRQITDWSRRAKRIKEGTESSPDS